MKTTEVLYIVTMVNSGERILVIENTPDISDLIARQVLRPLGYQVTVVADASSALREAIQIPPDLLFANLNLPDLNAKDLLVALTAQGISAPLVVVAEAGQERDIIQAFRVGAVDYLNWPARDAEVVSVVERALRQTRETRARLNLSHQLQEVNAELQRKVNDWTTITAIGKAVLSITDQGRLFTQIMESAVQVTEGDLGWLMLRDEVSKAFSLTAHKNVPNDWVEKIDQPPDDGIGSLITLSDETLLLHGKSLEKYKVAALGQAVAVVPIKVRSEIIGLLLVVRKAERAFTNTDQTLLEVVADYASISYVRARLFHALEHSAESAKIEKKRQAVILKTVRQVVRDELQVARYPVELLLTENSGSLTDQQRQTLQTVQAALGRLSRAIEKMVPSVSLIL